MAVRGDYPDATKSAAFGLDRLRQEVLHDATQAFGDNQAQLEAAFTQALSATMFIIGPMADDAEAPEDDPVAQALLAALQERCAGEGQLDAVLATAGYVPEGVE
jgi:hypothetical protein